MKKPVDLICLRTVRHSDTANILSAFSLTEGPLSFVIPAGNGRSATRIRAVTQPFCIVEAVADIVPGRELHRLSSVAQGVPLPSLRANPLKTAVALFLAEVCSVILRESQPDSTLWHTIRDSIVALDSLAPEAVANYHIWFLYTLGSHLGIRPDSSSYRPGRIFDMQDGIFRVSPPLHRNYVTADQARSIALLDRMTLSNLHLFRFTRQQRNDLLDGILRYLSIHYAPLGSLKSLPVLRSLF